MIEFAIALALAAQDLPAPVDPVAPAAPPAPVKLEFSGKPIAVPFACTEETLTAAGLTCPESEPCPVYLELAALEVFGTTMVLAGNLHASANTYSSILLRSDDSGKTWVEAHERIPQTVLDGVQFVDFSNGWISGQILSHLPRDPFFLITTDGGGTWRKRPLTDESQAAAIDSFFFESRTEGWLVVDRSRSGEPQARYQLYESKSGGDTWMLRESSGDPIRLKKSRPPLAGFRLRAEARTKTYRIEKQQAKAWVLVASFLVNLPDCSIGLQELTLPAEPEPEAAPVKPTAPPAKKAPALRKKTP